MSIGEDMKRRLMTPWLASTCQTTRMASGTIARRSHRGTTIMA
jgi:hypothetical protein